MPSRNRLTANSGTLVASPWLAQASDHHNMIIKNPLRVPNRSISFPLPAYISA